MVHFHVEKLSGKTLEENIWEHLPPRHSFWYYWRGGQPIKYAALWPVCVIEVMLVVLEESAQFMVALRQQSGPLDISHVK